MPQGLVAEGQPINRRDGGGDTTMGDVSQTFLLGLNGDTEDDLPGEARGHEAPEKGALA